MVPKCCHNRALISLKYQHIVTQISPEYHPDVTKYHPNIAEIPPKYITQISQAKLGQIKSGKVKSELSKSRKVKSALVKFEHVNLVY